LIKDVNEITKFYVKLIDEGLSPNALDYKGRSALHLAIKSSNFLFVKFLVDVKMFDVN
jgi:ankyrin repeat protein